MLQGARRSLRQTENQSTAIAQTTSALHGTPENCQGLDWLQKKSSGKHRQAPDQGVVHAPNEGHHHAIMSTQIRWPPPQQRRGYQMQRGLVLYIVWGPLVNSVRQRCSRPTMSHPVHAGTRNCNRGLAPTAPQRGQPERTRPPLYEGSSPSQETLYDLEYVPPPPWTVPSE